jgi:hypothetical protein
LLEWEGNIVSGEEKVQVLKHKIESYDKDWELVEIGPPTEKNITLMFKRKLGE